MVKTPLKAVDQQLTLKITYPININTTATTFITATHRHHHNHLCYLLQLLKSLP